MYAQERDRAVQLKSNLKIVEERLPAGTPAALAPPPRPLRRSVSEQMQERFERRRGWRRAVGAFYVVTLICYLAWRVTIINPHSLAMSLFYFSTDILAFMVGVSSIIIVWDYSHRVPRPAPQGLSVDVFVPAYKEPVGIIRRTVMAARDINYPHGTWLLDDGKRDELRQLAEELGVKYLRRPGNQHAKAGNINYALEHSAADFVMTFDADHIAQPHALDIMLGFFDDPDVALVQAPQDFYNTDAFQYMPAKRTGGIWHDQSYFYSIMLSAGDAVNGATCVGTGVIYRRSAIDSIGGIPTETVTEDLHTSLKLHKKGFKTVFLNEPVAYGIAAIDLAEFNTTRLRWGHGNLHVLAHENILGCKGLTLRQRIQYGAMALYYVEGFMQMLLLALPIISLTTGLQPFTITIFNVAVVTLFPLFGYLVLQEMGCGFSRHWANEVFSMARWPVLVQSFAGLTQRRIPFRTSSKAMKGEVAWRLMRPQIAVMVLSIIAVAAGIYRLHGNYQFGPLFRYFGGALTGNIPHDIDIHSVLNTGYTLDFIVIAGFWALYGAVRAGYFVWKTWSGARNSHDSYRFKLMLPVTFGARSVPGGCITSISEEWARLSFYPGAPLPAAGQEISFTAHVPAGPLPLRLRVEKSGNGTVEGRLVWEGTAVQDQLANALYSCDWHREYQNRNAYFMTPSDVLLSCLRLRSPFRVEYGDWQAVLLEAEGRQLYGVFAPLTGRPGEGSLVTFGYLPKGRRFRGLVFGAQQASPLTVDIMEEEPLSSLVEKGLDGAEARRFKIRAV